ncbi:MAG: cellulase family glycosylhydrolase, partial [Deltaproteobacteria bacterium]
MKKPMSCPVMDRLILALASAFIACGPPQDLRDAGDGAARLDAVPVDAQRDASALPDAADGGPGDAAVPPDGPIAPDVVVSACAGSTTFDISVPLALDRTTLQAGGTPRGSVTYRNCSSAPVTVQEIAIAGRPPGGTHVGGPYEDLTPVQGSRTVAVGDTVSLVASRAFTIADTVGSWVSYPTYQDAAGTWHDGPEVAFTVTSAAPTGTYPTGVSLRGINRAGMEYGDDWDGWTGQTYYEIPSVTQTSNELAYYRARGFNVLRLPISWERLQHTLNGPLDPAYSAGMMAYINTATGQGFRIVLDLHNYNRYAVGAHNASGAQVGTYAQHILGDGTLTIAHLTDVWVRLS